MFAMYGTTEKRLIIQENPGTKLRLKLILEP